MSLLLLSPGWVVFVEVVFSARASPPRLALRSRAAEALLPVVPEEHRSGVFVLERLVR